MLKIWCEKCVGKGRIFYKGHGGPYGGTDYIGHFICPNCNGKGYTESPETQRLLEIGRATVEAFDNTHVGRLYVWDENSLYAKKNVIETTEKLLEWHKEQEAKG